MKEGDREEGTWGKVSEGKEEEGTLFMSNLHAFHTGVLS